MTDLEKIKEQLKAKKKTIYKLNLIQEELDERIREKDFRYADLLESFNELYEKLVKIKSLVPLKYYEIEFVSIDSSGQESHVMKKTVSDYCPEMAIDTLNGQVMGFLFKTIRLVA